MEQAHVMPLRAPASFPAALGVAGVQDRVQLTLHLWQQAPWAHLAPLTSRQVVALQQGF
jgi:hypothetical protein